MRMFLNAILSLVVVAHAVAADATPLTVHKRSRTEAENGWRAVERAEAWEPGQTAIIVCDMWDSHHCLNAVRRAVEMAPRMNQVLRAARDRGVLIIHAPSSCTGPYEGHPGRMLAKSAPPAPNLPEGIDAWCRHIPEEDAGAYPIDQKDGGEDDDFEEHRLWHEKLATLGRNPKVPWKRQLALLDIEDADAISDSGVEIWNLLESSGITNVILLGVHTNMCVLGRPFGLRQLAKNGKNVVLMRDMTDTMYNPAKWPYVNHFTGTQFIVEHIEKYVCATITSVDFVGGEPFRFARDRRNIAILIGDDEYQTDKTLPAFVESHLSPLGFHATIVSADSSDKNRFPGMIEAIEKSDMVLVSVRRRLPPNEQLDALRQHAAMGKPVVGIRTASHAWCLRDEKQNLAAAERGQSSWPEFDGQVLGGHYTNHHGNGLQTKLAAADDAKDHPILRGLLNKDGSLDSKGFVGHGSLYMVRPLAQTTTPILFGSIEGQPPEPVAWTNIAGPKQARVFYTSLGHPHDFADPSFCRLLTNGIFWAIDDPYPVGQDLDKLLPAAVRD